MGVFTCVRVGGEGGVVVVATIPGFSDCFVDRRLFQGFRAATAMIVVVAAQYPPMNRGSPFDEK